MLGTFTLWFGWYGFNAGSALLLDSKTADEILALAGVNTTLAAGTAGIVALFGNLLVLERYTGEAFFDVKYLMNGSLSGLVAITGPCGVVEPWCAVLIGAVAALLYMLGTWALVKLRLDDAVDAIPGEYLKTTAAINDNVPSSNFDFCLPINAVHMFNGAWVRLLLLSV